METLSNQLKFCLVYPEFLNKLGKLKSLENRRLLNNISNRPGYEKSPAQVS